MKVSEGPASLNMSGGGAEAALGRAEAHLTAGQLSEAAESLEKGLAGTAAAAAVKGKSIALSSMGMVCSLSVCSMPYHRLDRSCQRTSGFGSSPAYC